MPGSGEAAHHVVLELFAQGNIVLCDHAWTVLTLLRSHRDDAQDLQIMPRHVYPLAAARPFTPTQPGVITQLLTSTDAAAGHAAREAAQAEAADAAPADAQQPSDTRPQPSGRRRGQQSSASDAGCVLGALNACLPYGPGLLEHCLASADMLPATRLPLPPHAAQAVEAAIAALETWFEATAKEGVPVPCGYLSGHTTHQPACPDDVAGTSTQSGEQADGHIVWDDFSPFPPPSSSVAGRAASAVVIPATAASPLLREYPSMDAAVDAFFGSSELHRVASARVAAETAALSKVDRMRADQAARAASLEAEAAVQSDHAALVEYNLGAVDAALKAVKDALATGMDWPSLHRLVKDERKAGNPVAGLITSMDLAKGTVTLVLGNVLDWEEADGGDAGDAARARPASVVTLRLDLSAAGNAREMHAARKKHQAKAQKTLEAAAQTLSIAERKAAAAVAAARAGATHGGPAGAGVTVLRQPCWWEKYTWFLTTENALVLSGRDPGQTATLLRRHLGPDDAVVTCDVSGAPLCIVKPPAMPVLDGAAQTPQPPCLPPPLSLHQAGTWCVCRSAAWSGKFSSSGWWAPASAIIRPPEAPSKPPGYLPPGVVALSGAAPGWGLTRGARRDLPPSQLILGFGILFRVGDDCVAHHLGERCIRSVQEEEASAAAAAAQGGGDVSGGDGLPDADVSPSGDEAGDKSGEDTASGDEEEGEGDGEEEQQGDDGGEEADAADGSGGSSESEPESVPAAPKAPPPAGREKAAAAVPAPPFTSSSAPRGKQKKLKKLKDKYGDQDDEDRALAMAALASAGKSKKEVAAEAEAARKAAAAQEAARRAEAKAAAAAARGPGKGKAKGGGGGQASMQTAPVHGEGEDEDEEGVEGVEDAQRLAASTASLQELHALTGCPRPEGDSLAWAVPVCGPYAALAAFKFKAKVTPGSTKKGKAAKQCLDSFARAVVATPRERELLHAIADMDGVAALCVPSGLKLSLTTLGKIGPPLTLGGKAKQQPVKKQQRGEKTKQK